MGVIRRDFGKKQRQAVRRFRKLLNLDALHEENIKANPVPYLERASERIFQLERAIIEAAAASRAHAGANASDATVVVNATEYESLLRCRAIVERARVEIDEHSDL